MGAETKYICDRCGKEGLSNKEFNTVVLFEQSYKYAGWTFPDIYLCEKCTDEFVEMYGLLNSLNQDSIFNVDEFNKLREEITDISDDYIYDGDDEDYQYEE